MKKIPVTFVLAGGGHTRQALAIVDKLAEHVQPSYIFFADENISEKKIRITGSYFSVFSSLREVRRSNIWLLIREVWKFLPAIIQSIRIIQKTGSKALVACGGGPSMAPIVAARLMNKKIIFIESISRTHSYSLVGRFSYYFFADLFLVQWKEMLQLYPKAIWAGRLF